MWPIARQCLLGSEGISLGLALIAAIGLSMRCIFSTWFYSTKKGRSRMAALCIISSCLFSYRRSPWLLLVSLQFNYTKKPPRRFVQAWLAWWLFEPWRLSVLGFLFPRPEYILGIRSNYTINTAAVARSLQQEFKVVSPSRPQVLVPSAGRMVSLHHQIPHIFVSRGGG